MSPPRTPETPPTRASGVSSEKETFEKWVEPQMNSEVHKDPVSLAVLSAVSPLLSPTLPTPTFSPVSPLTSLKVENWKEENGTTFLPQKICTVARLDTSFPTNLTASSTSSLTTPSSPSTSSSCSPHLDNSNLLNTFCCYKQSKRPQKQHNERLDRGPNEDRTEDRRPEQLKKRPKITCRPSSGLQLHSYDPRAADMWSLGVVSRTARVKLDPLERAYKNFFLI